ncbi:AAEL000066-PA [Aedes aegypti]|uniref:AAEL000066-PA n=2 Tax=Aedes aegypti TaxID=7159 RepID=A0A1S4EUU8_AEDAE|nr:ionotropic receptor 41f [Aedes aegypti]EAT48976.1 AAEL000066-PA [Aedes aegypti]
MNFLTTHSSNDTAGISMMSAVNVIALSFFTEYYTVCVIKIVFDYILISVPVPTVVINVDSMFNKTFQTAVDSGCQAFIVSERALITFLDVFVEIHDSSDQRSSNKRLLVLLDSNESEVLNTITKHSNTLELPSMALMAPNYSNDSIEMYSTKLYNDGSRSTVTVEIEYVEGPDYFPDKLNNMNGIPIHLCTLMYPPYTYYEETSPEKANARYHASVKGEDVPLFLDGTEVVLLIEFCRKYNCTIEASFDEVYLWGEVFDNHTGNGLLGSVVERRADIAVAAIYYWHQPYKFATYTQPISRSGITVLVPKPRILPPWRTPFLSFSPSLWAAVLAALCVGVIAVWCIEKIRYIILKPNELAVTLSDAVLTMIGFYMEQNARMRTDLMSCVLLFTSLLFAGFMVGNTYGGGLAGIMTIPQYEKSIDTTVDLAETGIMWGATALSWIFSIMAAPQPYMKKLVNTYRVVNDEFMTQHSKTHDMGFAGERTEFRHFVPADFVDNEASTMLQLLKDDLYWESVVAIITKTCPFKQKFNDLIMQIKQSGIQNYWELQASNNYLHGSVQLNILNARSGGSDDIVVKLTISHFLGAYMILAAGLGMATMSFLLETSRIWFRQSMYRKKANYAEKLT